MPALRPNLKAKFHKDPYTAKVFLSKPKPRDVPPMQHRPQPAQPRMHSTSATVKKDDPMFKTRTQILNPVLVERAGGDMSLAQKRLENARHQHLMSKLRGKTIGSSDFSAMNQTLGMSFYRDDGTMELTSQMGSASQQMSEYQESQYGEKSPREGEKAAKEEEKGPAQWSELDKFIELLLDNKHSDQSVFLYLNPNELGDPYDLNVSSYRERNERRFYTLSSKGLTLYQNDQPA